MIKMFAMCVPLTLLSVTRVRYIFNATVSEIPATYRIESFHVAQCSTVRNFQF